LGLIGDQQYGSPLFIAVGVWFPNPSTTRFKIDGDQEAIGLGDQAPTVWTAIAFRFAPSKSLLKKWGFEYCIVGVWFPNPSAF
jgi:hypothetical protein